MQDRYAGDIGDYGKLALLRAMEAQGLTVGVNWYLSKTLPSEIHDDGKYRIPSQYEKLDPGLSAALNKVFNLGEARSVQALEKAHLIASDLFVNEEVPRETDQREVWHQKALTKLADCDIVFLDPDNGLNVKSVKPGSPKSPKYVWLREVSDYIASEKSVIFYNHRPRKKAEDYLAECAARFSADPVLSGKRCSVVTFPRCSIRDYFIIPASQKHEERICQALQSLLDGPFGSSGFCFLQPSFQGFAE
jgi:hypothetical protein